MAVVGRRRRQPSPRAFARTQAGAPGGPRSLWLGRRETVRFGRGRLLLLKDVSCPVLRITRGVRSSTPGANGEKRAALPSLQLGSTALMASAETREDIEKRVDFEIALKRVAGNHRSFEELTFKGVELSRKPTWMKLLSDTLATNDTIKQLDLSGTGITDAALQPLVAALACGACPQLSVLLLRDNQLSMVGETMVQGLRRMRPALTVHVGDETIEGFVHEKLLVEGLTAWPADTLSVPGSSDLRCPAEVLGTDAVVLLSKGFSGTNGTKYTCEDAEFLMTLGTPNLVLVRLEPEARLRLATRMPGTVV